MTADLDLEAILQFTVSLAKTAGQLILEGSDAIQSAGSDINEKKNSVDLVTEYDVRVEELVKSEIGAKYPTFKFIGEESYAAGSRAPLTDEPTFCVDPIDGTTNFVHGFPYVCISIGLIYKRSPVLGVIYNPFLDYLYTAIQGKGSYLSRNGSAPRKLPLAKSPKPLLSLNQAQIGTPLPLTFKFIHPVITAVEWGNDRSSKTLSARSASFHRIAGDPSQGVEGGRMAHSIRSLGSSALNFAMVAQGSLDLYWEIGCWPWDFCAGVLIAQEAGGLATGSHQHFAKTSADGTLGYVGEEILMGRKYLVVRAMGDTKTEKGRDVQQRIMSEFYDTVEDYDAN